MELVITPTLCKVQKDESGAEIAPLFSGTVTIELPTMPESFRFKAKYGKRSLHLQQDKNEAAFETMELMADIAVDIKKSFSKVDLTELATQKRIESVDDLYSYEPAFGIISEIAMKFIQGFVEKN